MNKRIAVLPGDGIGPEVTAIAVQVLKKIGEVFDHQFTFEEGLVGAIAIDETGNPFPDETLQLCQSADAILFGAIGHPKYDNDPTAPVRPEQGLLAMRKALGLYANIRPVNTFKALADASPLKREIVEGVDFVVFRELTGGSYFGKKGRSDDRLSAYDTCTYTHDEIYRITQLAFEAAAKRRKKVTLVDKANVMETSRLWREVVQKYAAEHPEIELELMFVDNAAMALIQNPRRFDVILTENMFGDILTDEASVITGSLGMLPSASVGSQVALYEPIHGSYPQAAGQNIANPMAAVLSAATLLETSFNLMAEGKTIRHAVEEALNLGYVTKDINPDKFMSTTEVGQKICDFI
ncbi:3-isopropylmalate dehydrogenase [Adhaeribacter rhizoryzae]|uniref:3-isopropylmalate dehydrogenase n=1 Tax=Adhaeribacter rhizoryzae TaxID=2607907 RepID=A0A5M6DRW4_9BACT|nr:3-isopropylmalate dehydrogenase [Adhaeribacter rhizoryzae]KAA5549066.1 3-isopropylmalate dehydrogenase [Adhaeribacter rhizoryzae]